MADTLNTFEKPSCIQPVKMAAQCDEGSTAVVMPSVMMSRCADLVRFIFSDPSNIWHTQIRSMVFNPDVKLSQLAVMMGFSTTPDTEQADVFPRVVVLANDTYFGDIDPVTDGLFTNTASPSGEVFGLDNGMSHHSGNINFACSSRNALESLLMAESLAMYFIVNKNYIREDMKLSSFDVRSIKGPKSAEKPEGVYTTDVFVRWSSGMTWSSVEDGPAIGDTGIPQLNTGN
jgi:hypothetical protein